MHDPSGAGGTEATRGWARAGVGAGAASGSAAGGRRRRPTVQVAVFQSTSTSWSSMPRRLRTPVSARATGGRPDALDDDGAADRHVGQELVEDGVELVARAPPMRSTAMGPMGASGSAAA